MACPYIYIYIYIYIYTLRDFLSKKGSKLCHGPSNISFYMLLHIRIWKKLKLMTSRAQ